LLITADKEALVAMTSQDGVEAKYAAVRRVESENDNLKKHKTQIVQILTNISVARIAFLIANGAGLDDFGWSFVIKTRTMLTRKTIEQINTKMTGMVSIQM
jgi:hypothetical protein